MDRIEILPNIIDPARPSLFATHMNRHNDSAQTTNTCHRQTTLPDMSHDNKTKSMPLNAMTNKECFPLKMKHKLTQEEKNHNMHTKTNTGSFLASAWVSVFCICIIIVLIVAVVWLVYKLNDANGMLKRFSDPAVMMAAGVRPTLPPNHFQPYFVEQVNGPYAVPSAQSSVRNDQQNLPPPSVKKVHFSDRSADQPISATIANDDTNNKKIEAEDNSGELPSMEELKEIKHRLDSTEN